MALCERLLTLALLREKRASGGEDRRERPTRRVGWGTQTLGHPGPRASGTCSGAQTRVVSPHPRDRAVGGGHAATGTRELSPLPPPRLPRQGRSAGGPRERALKGAPGGAGPGAGVGLWRAGRGGAPSALGCGSRDLCPAGPPQGPRLAPGGVPRWLPGTREPLPVPLREMAAPAGCRGAGAAPSCCQAQRPPRGDGERLPAWEVWSCAPHALVLEEGVILPGEMKKIRTE